MIVVAGASGLAGSAVVRHFAGREGYDVVALSRKRPFALPASARHLALDLTDALACAAAMEALGSVTHLVYAAVNEDSANLVAGWTDPARIELNAAMLQNILDPILHHHGSDLRHVALIHGAKAYGTHLAARLPMPMTERLPRTPQDNFYYRQEDYVAGLQKGQDWHWTVFRPVMIAGLAVGANMNPFLVLGVYAALLKEAGLSMPMPRGWASVVDATDADVIAEAVAWAQESPAAWNDSFNLANGDVVDMHAAMRVAGEDFGLSFVDSDGYNMAEKVRELSHLWPGIVARHGLEAPADLDALLGTSLQVAGWSAVTKDPLEWGLISTIKVRRAGFNVCIDTQEMIRKYMALFRQHRLLPAGSLMEA